MLETSTSLLRQLRAGNDAGAWGRFVYLYTPYLYGWLLRQGVQHADDEDLVQETLAVDDGQVKRFEHNHRLGAFRCWLRRHLVNHLRVLPRSHKVGSTTPAH